MPTFDDIEIKVSFEFEAYCDTCGAGICNEVTATFSRSRGTPQIRVTACPNCISIKDDEIERLKDELTEKNDEIDELKMQVISLTKKS